MTTITNCMINNKKLCLIASCAVIISFICGFFVGQLFKCNKVAVKQKTITFKQIKNKVNKEVLQNESSALKVFINSYEECLSDNLNSEEYKKMLEIQKEVLEMSKGNTSVKFKVNDLKSSQGAKKVIKDIRKCQKIATIHLTKNDKRLMKSAISKMELQSIIAIYHGIR